MRKTLLFICLFILVISCSKESQQDESAVTKFNVSISINPEEGGIVNPKNATIDANQSIIIQASPNDGFSFNSWTGDWNSEESQISLIITKNTNLTANFSMLDTDLDGIGDLIDDCPELGGSRVDSNGCPIPPIYLHSNGVTVIAEEFAEIGETWILNDIEYTIVDDESIRELINNNPGDMKNVVTTRVTDMNNLFHESNSHNYWDVSTWDVSNVISMNYVFSDSDGPPYSNFNQDISMWDVSNVTSMRAMFANSQDFNQNIGGWDVSNVEDFKNMFSGCEEFNQDISSWDISAAKYLTAMFIRAKKFNVDIGNWNTSNVISFNQIFQQTEEFNQDIGGWDTSNGIQFGGMFANSLAFNRDISNWNLSKAQSVDAMFFNTSAFNQDISKWDVSNIINMRAMFKEADSFNQDLSGWNVENVEYCQEFRRDANSYVLEGPNFTKCNPEADM